MKSIAILLLIAGCLAGQGQTNVVRFEIVTNLVTADSNFRIVDGKLYNRAKSVLWEVMQGECGKVSSNLIILQTFKLEPIYEMVPNESARGDRLSRAGLFAGGAGKGNAQPDYFREKIGENKIVGRKIALRNYEGPKPSRGDDITFTAMLAGTSEIEGDSIQLWDCGKVNVVAVIKTNKITEISGNKLAPPVANPSKPLTQRTTAKP